MSSVIYADDVVSHNIQKYSFLSVDESEEESLVSQEIQAESLAKNAQELSQEVIESKNTEVNTELLEKIDQLSSNVVSLQMQIEEKQKEFSSQLEEAKQTSYNKGKLDGETQTRELLQEGTDELKTKFLTSIETVVTASKKVEDWIEDSKKEIPLIAFDIANEVIKKEVSKNSKDIAYSLALALLEDIKESKKVTIKLHPKDFIYVKEQFSDTPNLIFEKDEAIAKGGVVILSDYGNIDGNLKIRLIKAKELLES